MASLNHTPKSLGIVADNEWQWRLFLIGTLAMSIWYVRDFNWQAVIDSWPFLLQGLGASWLLALISISLGGLFAIPLAWARINGPVGIRHLAIAIIEIVRSTPELMLVFWIFFAFPSLVGFAVSNWLASIIALSLLAAVYLAEVFRGGIYSVPKEQWSLGQATGLTDMQIFAYIILPQAIRNMVPALISTLVMLFKGTALVYVIGVIEFFRAIILVNNAAYAPFALYTTMAIGYFICCALLHWVVMRLDPKYRLVE